VDLAAEFTSFKEDIKKEMMMSDSRLGRRIEVVESRVDDCIKAMGGGKKD